jgi:hypothetical protein
MEKNQKIDFAFVTSALAAFNDQITFDLITKKLMNGAIYKKFTPYFTTVGTTKIPRLNAELSLQVGDCDLTPAGSNVFSQRDIITSKVSAPTKICKDTLNQTFMSSLYKSLFDNQDIPFGEAILNHNLEQLQYKIETGKWNATGTADTNFRFTGIIKAISGDTAINTINTYNIQTSAYTGGGDIVSATGITKLVEDLYKKLDNVAKSAKDLTLFLSPSNYFTLSKALAETVKYTNILTQGENIQFTHPYISNLTVLSDIGMSDSYAVMTPISNIIMSMDKTGSEVNAQYEYDNVNRSTVLHLDAVVGFQVEIPEYVSCNIAIL